MKNKDIFLQKKDDILQRMNEAAKSDDSEAYTAAFGELASLIEERVIEEVDGKIKAAIGNQDYTIRASRGERVLTSEEKDYYNKLVEAYKAPDVKQALSNLEITMPETIINSVFEDMQESSELLDAIDFVPSGGIQRFLQSEDGQEMAKWGPLSSKIVEELSGSIGEVDMTSAKLTAFIPISQDMLELGAEWIDKYIRKLLTEALINGLEDGIVNGTGLNMPIGMTKQVGKDVEVKGGEYPDKETMVMSAMDPDQLGNILAELATNSKGKTRSLRRIIFVVNPVTYFKKVFPATRFLGANGQWVETLPINMKIVQSHAVKQDRAILGDGSRYFFGGAIGKGGRTEFSDHYQFLEDLRTYKIKFLGNGRPKDDNAFRYLDITTLNPVTFKTTDVPVVTPSQNLKSLKIGKMKLSPTFNGKTTTEYTATATDLSNTITAVAENVEADVTVLVNGTEVSNNTTIEWKPNESNTVKVLVEGGKNYTVTVTGPTVE